MLLRDDVCIGQPAHAWISGQLARNWARDPVEPWEEVCLAAEQHDVGMAGWDRPPAITLTNSSRCLVVQHSKAAVQCSS